ncbi:MAG: hypothetical protein ABR84_04710 [Cryomorphaceae bacterium BACL21 MAG-121220-bin10]|jgi:hypothetical protein|nr:MAG: hypothetical protein ABR84_04710 [Cryomorphaceae bacterium BACL21 MAG-121220-bin10]MDA0700983.1 hypothetical protein [Bacteroidota bacterium]MDB9782976.1 hypothetical protein [Winogradskyella sp.]|tara:strand:+ start:36008 stop:36403 length:396 start_codon:yes stop_codon:yes gene_type:complete
MKTNIPNSLRYPPIYLKAMEILQLSRHAAYTFVDDLCGLQSDGKEHPGIYFTGDMVQQSVSLGPEILKAEGQTFSEDKRHYAHRVRRLTKLLVATCERIEHSPVQSKDFLQMLKKELKLFKKLQRTWLLTL